MENRITWLSILLIFTLFNAFGFYQWNLPLSFLFSNRPSVPLLVLSFGPAIQVGVLWMVGLHLKESDPREKLFPRVAVTEFDSQATAFFWERTSAAFVLGLPMISFTWAWHRFLTKGEVWEAANGMHTHRFELVSPSLFLGSWDTYRYGNIATGEGASFVPFWQPALIMGLGTAIAVFLTGVISLQLFKRYSIRKRKVTGWLD
ncbi:MAG: hypothetical protein ABJF50_10660 [Paracoccaceae bacterium]